MVQHLGVLLRGTVYLFVMIKAADGLADGKPDIGPEHRTAVRIECRPAIDVGGNALRYPRLGRAAGIISRPQEHAPPVELVTDRTVVLGKRV